jgi:DNA-binding transcriptional ArsR family regulator
MLDTPERVAAALHPLRVEILALLREPDSATGLAGRMGQTRQVVNYHLRALEAAGMVELVEERPRRGLVERIVRRSHDVLVVDPALFGALDRRDRVGLTGVIAAASDMIERAAQVAGDAGQSGERVATVTLDTVVQVESPAALGRLVEEMAEVLARYDRPGTGSLPFRFAVMALPDPKGDPS